MLLLTECYLYLNETYQWIIITLSVYLIMCIDCKVISLLNSYLNWFFPHFMTFFQSGYVFTKYWQCKEKQFVCRMPLGNAQRFSRSIPEVDYKIVTLHLKRPKVLNSSYRYYPSMPKLFLARFKHFWYAWIITYILAWAGEAYSRVFNLSIVTLAFRTN